VRIEDGTVIAPNTVIPSFSLVRGRPGVVVEELPETASEGLDCEFLLLLNFGFTMMGSCGSMNMIDANEALISTVKQLYRMI